MFEIIKDNVEFIIYLVGLAFIVYTTFKNPQVKTEKDIIKINSSLENLQVSFTNLRDNHIHTLQQKIEATCDKQNIIENEVIKLCTIIEERIPKKL